MEWVAASLDAYAQSARRQPFIDTILAAVWTTAYINNLPDSCFLYIESGGSKDSDGKTTPRSLRHFPVKDDSGAMDMPHLRNALARIPQSNLPADVKKRLTSKAQTVLKRMGGKPSARLKENTMPELYEILGLGQDADDDAITSAVTALKEKADQAEAAPDEDTLKGLIASAAKGEQAAKELHEMKVTGLLDTAVKEGKILPVQRDGYQAMANADFDNVKALLDATPPRAFKETGTGGEDGGGGGDAGPGDPPTPEDVTDERGNVVARKVDSDWLAKRADAILAEAGKTAKTATGDEYRAALDQAQTEALTIH